MPQLFSYGTLQDPVVQFANFGRRLQGHEDELLGYERTTILIENPQFVALSGKAEHSTLKFTGRADSRVTGTVFEITDSELSVVDDYEKLASYVRIAVTMLSGAQVWVYVSRLSVDG